MAPRFLYLWPAGKTVPEISYSAMFNILSAMFSPLSRFQALYKTEVQKRLAPEVAESPVREEDLSHLPELVQKYLKFVGAVGKPRVRNFRAAGTGSLYRSSGGRGMKIATRQYNFFDEPARLYYITTSFWGIPVDGLHTYTGDNAAMSINAAYLFPVVRASGGELNLSETVTLFNDRCLFAPSTLIERDILWEPVDPHTVWARFTHNGITISAMLYFSESGKLTGFVSDDRYLSPDGKNYARYQWSTPVKKYRDFDGRKVPVSCEATWTLEEGNFTYIRFNLEEIEYNCSEFR
jgi:hypothetical protein